MLTKMSDRTLRSGCKKCQTTDVYWAKDDQTSRYVLVNADAATRAVDKGAYVPDTSRHLCNATQPVESHAEIPTEDDEAESVPVPVVVPVVPVAASDDATAALDALRRVLSPTVKPEDVRAIVAAELASMVFPTRTVTVREKDDVTVTHETAHPQLANVITDILAGEHVFMVGPAGTGKSHIAQQVAEALGLDYYPVSVGPQTSEAKLTGYCDANGNYIPSPHVRQAVEKGGLLFLDELDRSNPGVMTILNACLANGHMTFPDKVVPIHPDLRVLAAGNTYGTGPDRKFVGAQQIDGATLDRFSVETIDYDEALEHSLCLATGLEAGKVQDILAYVRCLRRNANNGRMSVTIGMRAAVGACRLVQAGRPWRDVVNARMRRGLSDTDWTKLSADAPAVTF